jgi:hypothetical protein
VPIESGLHFVLDTPPEVWQKERGSEISVEIRATGNSVLRNGGRTVSSVGPRLSRLTRLTIFTQTMDFFPAVHGGARMSVWKDGAGDRDRTGDIQLGKLEPTCRSSQNQSFRAGHLGPSAALSARIEHDSEHNFPLGTFLPQPTRNTMAAHSPGHHPQSDDTALGGRKS